MISLCEFDARAARKKIPGCLMISLPSSLLTIHSYLDLMQEMISDIHEHPISERFYTQSFILLVTKLNNQSIILHCHHFNIFFFQCISIVINKIFVMYMFVITSFRKPLISYQMGIVITIINYSPNAASKTRAETAMFFW